MFFNFIHPFTMIIAGPTNCGKTTFLTKLLESQRKMINVDFDRIVWCYSEATAKPKIDGIEYNQGLPMDIENHSNEKILYILDDLMADAFNSKTSDIFTKGSHHRNISVILVVQNIFHKGNHARDISLNAKYLVVFKNPRDRQQFSFLARQIYPEDSKELLRVYNEVTVKPHGYLLIDLSQEINDLLRFRTDIFNSKYSAICYGNLKTKDESVKVETIEKQQAYVISA